MQYLGTGGDYSNTGLKKRLKKKRRRKSKLGNGKLGKRQQADKAFHAYDEYLDGPCDPKIYDCEGFSYEEYDPNNGDDRCETPWIFLTTGCYRFLKLSHNLTSSKCAISPIRGRTPSRHLHGYSYFKVRYFDVLGSKMNQ